MWLSYLLLEVIPDLIKELCDNYNYLNIALAMFISEGWFRFSIMGEFDRYVIRSDILQDIHLVNEGLGQQVIDGVMQWVKCVRLRAL